MPLDSGQIFAGYTVIRLLGSGGMGEVYLAEHPRLPRRYALKILRTDVSANPSFRERFIREADLAAALWHPHIVGVHDRGEHDDQLWIAMDYVDGPDAAHLMAHRYPAGMPIEEVINIVTAVASALDYAHKRDLLHRDVKPANIMLTNLDEDERRVLLTDFGIARPTDDISGLTTTNMTVGTVAYAAPEQLMGEDIDGRADQYALAATAYFLLTGNQVFPHTNPAVVISKHLNSTPPPLAHLNPDLARLDPVVAAGLAKDPDDRFRCCADFGKALAEQASTSNSRSALAPTTPAPVAPHRSAPHTSSQRPPPETMLRAKSRTRRWIIGAGVGAVVLVVGAILAIAWPRHEQPEAVTDLTPSRLPVASTTTPPPPPPTFPAEAIDDLLPGAGEVNDIVGATTLEVQESSFGTSDHTAEIAPATCAGVVYAAEQIDYGDTRFVQMRDQTLGFRPYTESDSYSAGHPWRVQQMAAIYASEVDSQNVLKTTEARWRSCASAPVVQKGYEFSTPWELSDIQLRENVLTVSIVDPAVLGPQAGACQHALAVRANVVAEAVTCTSETKVPGSGAERIVLAILERARV